LVTPDTPHYPITILKQLEPLLRAAPSSLSIGFALVDRSLRFSFVNSALAAMNRLPAKAHIGATLRKVLSDTADTIEPVYDSVFSTGKARLGYECSGGLPSRREEVDWTLSLFPIASSPTEVTHVAAMVLDTTLVRGLQRRLAGLCQPPAGSPVVRETSSVPDSELLILETTETAQLRSLTRREIEALKLLVNGNSNKEVAAILGVSTRTVESHRAKVMLKLHVHSMIELMRIAIRGKLISL
jgi:DNA-binding CsgD family transcriptional regulator